jgi:hypothetical protein
MNPERITYTSARKSFSCLLDQVKYQGKHFHISRYGMIDAMLLPVDAVQHQREMEDDSVDSSKKTLCTFEEKIDISFLCRLLKLKFIFFYRKDNLLYIATCPDFDLGECVWNFESEFKCRIKEDFKMVDLKSLKDDQLIIEILTEGCLVAEEEEGLFKKWLADKVRASASSS